MNDSERSELVKYRIAKANSTLNEIHLHIENQLWNTAVNRLYYACYYAVTALLINSEINTQNSCWCSPDVRFAFYKTRHFKKRFG